MSEGSVPIVSTKPARSSKTKGGGGNLKKIIRIIFLDNSLNVPISISGAQKPFK